LALTRLAQRLLTLQPGHSLISPKLTLSVGSSPPASRLLSMLLPKLGGFWLLPPRDLPHLNESHPMDHDSNSSGHANTQARPPPLVDALNPLPSNPQESYVYDPVGNRTTSNQNGASLSTRRMKSWRTPTSPTNTTTTAT